MQVEERILNVIPYLLKLYDPKKLGCGIDIGVGSSNFFFRVVAEAGYNSFAVEPMPTPELQRVCGQFNVKLIQSCISDVDGNITMYTGQYGGGDCVDISSINADWWGITDRSKEVVVSSKKLTTLIKENFIQKITYIKADTEGSEYQILRQLKDLPIHLHPSIVEIEYGGGGCKYECKGGWSNRYQELTILLIELLLELGYKYACIFERENEEPFFVDLSAIASFDTIFENYYVYGDILFFKVLKLSLADLNSFSTKGSKNRLTFFWNRIQQRLR